MLILIAAITASGCNYVQTVDSTITNTVPITNTSSLNSSEETILTAQQILGDISIQSVILKEDGVIRKEAYLTTSEQLEKVKELWNQIKVKESSDVTVQEYRELGLGFRDIRLYETTHMILDKKVDLEAMKNNPNTMEVREQLLSLSGVGPKVADCILLFSDLKRFEVFPIDVWVRRVMNDLYIHNEDETKVNKKQIEKIAQEKFGDLAGLAQQYLFYWRREA